ncbi:ABC transporter permease [Actinoplanes sp. NEAU-A12]|uniref:ABC transporter permease n=1 Tax=Actinoplanes sandaracinus TaxID=3045177 RepID=A0ABT6WX07_9ACTN|nr:FtsX-like permease family protein [Actinoplanes sandaracinus]MDI6104273.1 ABC transporter permease [Actinoplanes sandaracinus]
MFALVFGAVRTRAAQALTILVLTAIAAAVAAAGPWYGFAAVGKAADAYLRAAPADQRIVTVTQRLDTEGRPDAALGRFTDQARAGLPPGAGAGTGGMTHHIEVRTGPGSVRVDLAHRQEFCDHVRLDGACPAARGEVAISHEAARRLGAGLGGNLEMLTIASGVPLSLRVVGLYALTDVTGPYWANRLFRAASGPDPLFTAAATFEHPQLLSPMMAYDVVLPDALLRGAGGFDLDAELTAADRRLGQSQLRLTSLARPLHQAIVRDRALILNGVTASGAQLLILTWFAIGLAGWYTLRDRRADAGLLKLRGVSRSGRLRLAWGQHLVPLVAGVLFGAPAGYLLAWALAGPVPAAADRATALTYSAAAVAAVLFGGLAVLAAVEATVLGRPVAALLQRAASGRGTWRPALVDTVLLAVAAVAIYQARSGGPADGLGRAALALATLAVGLVAARLLSLATDRGGAAALRSGRLLTGLTALRISRSPGTDRLFALVVVSVALFVTAAGGWAAENEARAARSAAELGAHRVLNVGAANRTVLLNAVRGADPGGREAMAVVRNRTENVQVLEVDTARLGAVAGWRPEYGRAATLPAAAAAAALTPLPLVTGDRLTLNARRDGPADVVLTLHLQHEGTGQPAAVGFGTLRGGDQTVTVPVTACATAPGCRIIRWDLTTPPNRTGRTEAPPAGTAVTVRGLGQGAPATPVLDATALGDIARWRVGTNGAALDLVAADGTLRLATDPNVTKEDRVGVEAWASDSLLPLPALLAGPVPERWVGGDALLPAYGEPVPVQVTGSVAALPAVGGAGLLVDLDTTRRLAADADPGGQFQVWLAPSARPGIVEALTAGGLTVTAETDVTAYADRLGVQSPAILVRFELLAGAAALLLAAAIVAVAATVDRRSLAEQFAALRVQGLPRRVAVRTGWAGTAALIISGLLGGVLAALLAIAVTRRAVPPFTDGWAVLAPPGPLDPLVAALAVAVALIVLGLTGLIALQPLMRSLREGEAGR